MNRAIQVLSVVLLSTAVSRAQRTKPGIVGKKAPAWNVSQWFNLSAGKKKLELADFAGKVVYLYCFQSWCPGCHSRGFPTLVKLSEEFKKNKDVVFVAIQTVFEGFATNTLAGARRCAKKFKLNIPFGHDPAPAGQARHRRSGLMTSYRTGGTPWTVFIDRKGIVRYNDFHINAVEGSRLIKSLLADKSPAPLMGTRFPQLHQFHWLTQDHKAPNLAKSKLTLFRWWTSGCPFCIASLPALEVLRDKYGNHGFDVIGIFHPKPVRNVKDATIWKYAREAGFMGTLAVDPKWSVLRKLFARGAPKTATSISILVDQKGQICWVHPGPRLHPSKKNKAADQAYAELDRLIAARLGLLKSSKRIKRPSSRKRR